MKLLERLSNLVRSNLNAAIDSASDPGKEIDLLVEEMDDESRRARVQLRDQIAQEKLAQKRVEEAFRNVNRWQEHAERAVQAGDDDLAREALQRLEAAERAHEAAERTLAEQSQAVQRMTEQLRDNDRKLVEIRARKETLKARARAAKQTLGKGGDAFSRFDNLVTQIEMNEHQAEAVAEMADDPLLNGGRQLDRDRETEEKFRRLLPATAGTAEGEGADVDEANLSEVERRLRALKARMK